MKKTISFLLVLLFSSSFVSYSQSQMKQNQTIAKTKLEVLYFHATNRCATCNAVESNTKALLDEQYKSLIDNGTIKFKTYNIDESENKSLVEKYEISFSTLLLVKPDGTKTDFTDEAFQYARTNPKKYKELLKTEINKQLNN